MTDLASIRQYTSTFTPFRCFALLDSISFPIIDSTSNSPFSSPSINSIGLFKHDIIQNCLTLFISPYSSSTPSSTTPISLQYTHFHQFLPDSSYLDQKSYEKIKVETISQILCRVLLTISSTISATLFQERISCQKSLENAQPTRTERSTARIRAPPAQSQYPSTASPSFPLLTSPQFLKPLSEILQQAFSTIKFTIGLDKQDNQCFILNTFDSNPVEFSFPLKPLPSQLTSQSTLSTTPTTPANTTSKHSNRNTQQSDSMSSFSTSTDVTHPVEPYSVLIEATISSLVQLWASFTENIQLQSQIAVSNQYYAQLTEKDQLIAHLQNQIQTLQHQNNPQLYPAPDQHEINNSSNELPNTGNPGDNDPNLPTALPEKKNVRKRAVLRPNQVFKSKKRVSDSDDDEW